MNIFTGLINGMVAGATPILLAALGGSFTYYAGVFNIAMEGMLLSGAFFSVLGSYYLQSWPLAILAGIVGALLLALIFILFAVVLKTDEFITGIALNLFALGATTYMLRQIFGVKGAFADAAILPIPPIHLPLLADIPGIGPVLSGQNLLVYLAVLAAIGCSWLLFGTKFGLRLRAAGYNAPALAASGVSVAWVQSVSLLLCAVLCGLGGAFLSLGYLRLFAENMSAGRGWIALAAIILVKGNPWGIVVISLLFGFFDGLGLLLQSYAVPSQFTSMAPYVATLVALYLYSVRAKKAVVG